ncbi:MAG: hypothetical protein WHV61_08400 [Burkholderiales bacterium]
MSARGLDLPDTEFTRKLTGTLFGIMTWDQLSRFWRQVDPGAGWYLYAVGERPPAAPADAEHVQKFMADLDRLLRQEHREDYCSIVYADDLEHPTFIKIYDPNHLGSACGSSKSVVLPGWVMSQVPPVELTPSWVVPQSRRRWWQGFLASLR